MDSYDPLLSPEPSDWLGLSESDRLGLVDDYHRRARVTLPNAMLHTTIHVTVENQVAMGIPAVVEALGRLQREGLDRHEAVHAIGLVLVEHLHQQLDAPTADPNAAYEASLALLTAAQFRDV